jgi:uncharacterized repeat protein (TIGR03847 family)
VPQTYSFSDPERFVAGTVGEPGQRTFFLQAREGSRLATVLLEKEQVQALAERLDELLDQVVRRTGGSAPVPALPPDDVEDTDPLDQPIDSEFRVGTMTLAWDNDQGRVVVEAFATGDEVEPVQEEEEPPDDRDVLVVTMTGMAARAFAKRAHALVAAGRPTCPLCALPLDPDGHVCPRQNGYMRREEE